MIHLLAFLAAMLATAIFAAILSLVCFRDYREGFRILYHLLDTGGSSSTPDTVPQESRRGLAAQLSFASVCLAVASIGYINVLPLFARLLAG